MKTMLKVMMKIIVMSIVLTHAAVASDMMAMADTNSHDMGKSDKFGDLIHESVVNGHFLTYYFMDLRKQNSGDHAKAAAHEKEMEKPHHIMVYIMDKDHKPVLKGKVGFMIKDEHGNKQMEMGMFMSDGFGTTADMKKKGVYTIITKAVLGDNKLMDRFEYTIN